MKVVVIGTGIVGASAAYQLARNNVEVVMVDRKEEGKATSAGAGIVCPWVSRVENADWYTIAKRGAEFYTELINNLKEDGEGNVGYKKVGAICVSEDLNHLDSIEKRVKEKRRDAPEVGDIIRLNHNETQKIFPPINARLESVFVSGAARVDGKLLRDALKRASERHGARMLEGNADLVQENGNVIGVKVDGEKIQADQIIMTAGAWTPELLQPLGITLNVKPQRGQIAHISMQEKDTSDWPVVLPDSSHYMLAFDDSRVVAGATREDNSGFDYRLTAGGVNEVLSEALHVAPGLNNGTLKEVRIGFRPMGTDILPIIGHIENYDNVKVATGLGASGLTMGPYVGSLAASLIHNNDIEIDLTPYSPSRAMTVELNN